LKPLQEQLGVLSIHTGVDSVGQRRHRLAMQQR
jgi:hypothetical protein